MGIKNRIQNIRKDNVMFSTLSYMGMAVVYVFLGIVIGFGLSMLP